MSEAALAQSQPNRTLSYASGSTAEVFTEIYQPHINMAVWQRSSNEPLHEAVQELLAAQPHIRLAMSVPANNSLQSIAAAFSNNPALRPLYEDLAQLVDMFCCLFDLPVAGLRLTGLDRAMCPFHVDKVRVKYHL